MNYSGASERKKRIYKALEAAGVELEDLFVYYGHLPTVGWHIQKWGQSALFAKYLGPNVDRVLHNIKVGYCDHLRGR